MAKKFFLPILVVLFMVGCASTQPNNPGNTNPVGPVVNVPPPQVPQVVPPATGPGVAQIPTDLFAKAQQIVSATKKVELNKITPAQAKDPTVQQLQTDGAKTNEAIQYTQAQVNAALAKAEDAQKAAAKAQADANATKEDLVQAKAQLDVAVSQLNTWVNLYQNEAASVDAINARIDALQGQVYALATQQANTQSDVNQLRTRVGEIESNQAQTAAQVQAQATAQAQALAQTKAQNQATSQQQAQSTTQQSTQGQTKAQTQSQVNSTTNASTQNSVKADGAVPGTPTAQATTPSTTPTFANVPCNQFPSDLEVLPRYSFDNAPMNVWFHPIYDQDAFDSSKGTNGQWSWYHSFCLTQAQGGKFMGFDKVSGQLIFRMDQTQAKIGFAVLTTSKWKTQFFEKSKDPSSVVDAINFQSMDDTTINVVDVNGNVLANQKVSAKGGDLTVQLSDVGITRFAFQVNDPAATKETHMWVGPYDREKNINTLDARKLAQTQ